jgi:hypothetical protein
MGLLDSRHRFMVLVENGRRQPEGSALTALIDLTSGPPVVIDGPLDVAVYFFTD